MEEKHINFMRKALDQTHLEELMQEISDCYHESRYIPYDDIRKFIKWLRDGAELIETHIDIYGEKS